MSGLTVTDAEVRTAFDVAADWFLTMLGHVPSQAWGDPGLGEWTVKELVAHTARAFATIEQYLATAPVEVVVADPVAYFLAGMGAPGVNAAVAERGRQAAAALGDDPIPEIEGLARRVRALVSATPDDAVCNSAAGGIRFADYLATRVLELMVHTTDLCAALARSDPPPEPAARVSLAVLAGLAAARDDRGAWLRTLTGRLDPPPGSTVLG